MNEPKRFNMEWCECTLGPHMEEVYSDMGGLIRIDDPAYQEILSAAKLHESDQAVMDALAEQSADDERRHRENYDALWQIVYPGKTDWEYPAQVIRHLRDAYQELRRIVEALDSELVEAVRVMQQHHSLRHADNTCTMCAFMRKHGAAEPEYAGGAK